MKNELTEKDHSIIDFLIKTGYGWGRFALSVKQQGRITEKQRDKLYDMFNWVKIPMAKQRASRVAGYTSLTDEEIMKGNDYE